MSLKPKRVEFEKLWPDLLKTIQGVITCESIERSVWSERFSDVYKLCTALPEPQADRLFSETKAFLESHVKKLYISVCECEQEILTVYYRHWEVYSRGSSYLNQLFGYLNTTFIKKQKFTDADISYGTFSTDLNEHMLEIGELSLDAWRKHMIDPLNATLTRLLMEEISRDRRSHVVNESVVKGVVSSLVEVDHYKKKLSMQLYQDTFETPFIRETGNFYRSEASRLKTDCSCSEYMEKVLQHIDREKMRCTKFVHGSSISTVVQECQQRMVADHLNFLSAEMVEMVQQEKHKDLANMYRLIQPLHDGLAKLLHEMELHIKNSGLAAIKRLETDNLPANFVESVLKVHKHFCELIRNVFNNDQQFVGALDKACISVINSSVRGSTCRSPELLARYCDILLKKNFKLVSEADLDLKLTSCVTVFKYLEDKDVFQRFYSRMLAKRLIYSLSQSMDAEELMINKLKQACGYEFTSNLHRMFTDMSLSEDLNTNFQDHLQKKGIVLDVSFNVMVLRAGAWPIATNLDQLPAFRIPQELEKAVRTFDGFYSTSFSGRKLTWLHNYSFGDLKFNYLSRTYIVNMVSYLMGILLSFNSTTKQSFAEITSCTGMSEKDLTRHLTSLCDSKILLTEGEIKNTSVFWLNMEYSNKRTKFKIATAAAQRDTPQDIDNTHAAVDDDRKMYLQASIVRIMKSRKKLKHNELIQQVIAQAVYRFHPNVSMIKKSIEMLIDKQYIERDSAQPDQYFYLA